MSVSRFRSIAPHRAVAELEIGAPRDDADGASSSGPWHISWHQRDDSGGVPDEWQTRTFRFHTSGTDAVPMVWTCTGARLVADALQLAVLPGLRGVEAVVGFAPPRHTYGASAMVMLPALLGTPAWFWPSADCAPPPLRAERLLIVAIPWSFRILLRHLAWLRGFASVTVLHSSAALPGDAARLHTALTQMGTDSQLVEIFGSTETGAVAHRSGWMGQGPWTLFEDVEFVHRSVPGEEVRLAVTGPRLAQDQHGATSPNCAMDDLVEVLDDRRFAFHGRRRRLVKINGERHDLDRIEERLRTDLPQTELVCVLVADPLRGENFDVVVADRPGISTELVRSAAAGLGLSPGTVRVVDRIAYSELGKPRHLQNGQAR